MEVLGLAVSTYGLVEAIKLSYEKFQHIKGLPRAFEQVVQSLPLVRETLQDVIDTLQDGKWDEDTHILQHALHDCREKAALLLDIFSGIEKRSQEEGVKDWSIFVRFYRNMVATKGQKVESLMESILNNLKIFTRARDVLRGHVENLDNAIGELSRMEPSLPDSDFLENFPVESGEKIALESEGSKVSKDDKTEDRLGSSNMTVDTQTGLSVQEYDKLEDVSTEQAALFRAVRSGNTKLVSAILEKDGIDLEHPDENGRTALSWAAGEGNEAMVRFLLARGSTVDSSDHTGRDPLSWAAERGHEIIVGLLLHETAGPNRKDTSGRTPLSWATEKEHIGVVLQLLRAEDLKGRDVELKENGWLSNTEVGKLMTVDNQHSYSKLDLEKHQPPCAHWPGNRNESESVNDSNLDLRAQFLRRVDMHNQLSILCGLAGVFPPEATAFSELGWARFSAKSASVFFTNNLRDSELLGESMVPKAILQLSQAVRGLISGATHLQESGFCCNEFTVLTACEHESYQPRVRMNTVPFRLLVELGDHIDALARGLSEFALSQSVSMSGGILHRLFGIKLPQIQALELRLHYLSLAVQALCLALMLYSRAHVEGFQSIYLADCLNEVILRGSSPGQPYIVVEQRKLACMGEMVGGKVFVFRMTSQPARAEAKGFPSQLEATCEEIVDSWGPGSLLFADPGKPSRDKIVGLVLRGGIIRLHGTLNNGDRLFHWGGQPVTPTPFSAETFSYTDRIVIGAVVDNDEPSAATSAGDVGGRYSMKSFWNYVGQPSHPVQVAQQNTASIGSIAVNEQCNRQPEETWDASQWYSRLLGTGPPAWEFVERSWMLQFGDKFLGQVGAAQTKQPGVPAKKTVLDRWTSEGKLSLLEELHGLQVSLCTGVAQRVPLRLLVRDNLMDYVRSLNIDNWGEFEEQAIEAMASKAKFTKWESQLVPESRACMEKMVDKLLTRLKDTGFDKNGVELAVLWPNKTEAEFCVKIPPEGEQAWCRMLRDTEWSTTFAVATNSCLVAPSVKCRGDESLWGGMNMLATFVYPSFAGSVPSTGKRPEKTWQIRHHRLYWNGEIGGKVTFFSRKVSKRVAELEFYPNWLDVIPSKLWSRFLSSDVLVEAPRADFKSEEVFVVSKSKIGSR